MTHKSVPREKCLETGVTDGFIRLSVGLEETEDLIADLEQALKGLDETVGATAEESLVAC